MAVLRTEGFGELLASVTAEAATENSAYAAAWHVATIGGRLTPTVGLRALTDHETLLLDTMLISAAVLDRPEVADSTDGDRLAVLTTGKVCVLRDGEAPSPGAVVFGVARWPNGRPAEVTAEARRLHEVHNRLVGSCLTWLHEQGATRAAELVTGLRHTLRHVGPMRVYVGATCFTNLGKGANLVGKSVGADSDRCRLKALAGTPLAEWTAADACFVVCQSVLLASGTPSRNEEFSGTQLLPNRLAEFLRDRIDAYDGTVPDEVDALTGPDLLFALARFAGALRKDKLRRGIGAYRTVQSMTINKREHFFATPVTGADLPELFVRAVLDVHPTATSDQVHAGEFDWHAVVADETGPGRDGFATGFEEVLHCLVAAAAAATGTDVSMSRGPRDVARLARLVGTSSPEPGHWKTSEYYCCVVPSDAFRARFAEEPEQLTQVVRAIAARMRWNCWHFMPHAAGVADLPEFADRDWFFAPAMPDMTEWTSHHHQGHVANGVRHAIRVPLPLTIGGVARPGVHDLRLMRSDEPVYQLADLRAAVAIGEVLRGLYQAHADRLIATGTELIVTDFENRWYQDRYGPGTVTSTTRTAVEPHVH
jgi:hypothetical protein